MKLDGKHVWVTGASSGIGAALVPALLARGAKVIVTARRAERLEALVARHGTDRVAVVAADLGDPAAIEPAAAQAKDAFGRVDALINNAGRSQRSPANATTMDDVRALMELNFMAPVALTQAVLPEMVARGSGHICAVSSVAGYVPTPHRSTYCASKFAVRGYFDSLRAELARTGVEVSVICPGYVRTEISERAVAEEGRVYGKKSPAIEGGLSPERCAEAIVRAIERGRAEVHVGGPEVAGIQLARFLPGLVRRLAPRLTPE